MFKAILLPPVTLERTAQVTVQRFRYSVAAASQLIKVFNSPAPHAGSIRVLSLNRPHARNAISLQLLRDLKRHVQMLREEGGKGSTRVLILASEVDNCFCAGADLKERAGFNEQEYVRSPLSNSDHRLRLPQDQGVPCLAAYHVGRTFEPSNSNNNCTFFYRLWRWP